ncbi:hypothetical protein ACQPW3_11590 [Actinosynnema sp. CA-248983]
MLRSAPSHDRRVVAPPTVYCVVLPLPSYRTLVTAVAPTVDNSRSAAS